MLPYIVKRHVNNVLADIPGYYGHVEDIDIALFRGAYVIKGLYLNRVNAGSQIPFLDFEKTDISIEWKSLFKGKIVSEIFMTRPRLTYVFEDHKKNNAKDSEFKDWTEALTDLVPIAINRLSITDGKMAFMELAADPDIDLHLRHINLNATNLRNVIQKKRALPSVLSMTAVSVGDGKVTMKGRMDMVKQIPDMDISFSLENASVTALNDFTDYYAKVDFEKGIFYVYSEIAIADGYLKGYIKPMLKDSKLISKNERFLEKVWEGFVGFFKFILKNQKTDTLATKVPIEGDLNDVKTGVWATIGNIFRNAWIEAFKNIVDDDIDFEDAIKGADEKKE